MDDPGGALDEPHDDSATGQDVLADAADSPDSADSAGDDDVEGEPGLPPAGDDPMDGAAPSG
jgi:hypothetical protein